jgi:hypothetical protein
MHLKEVILDGSDVSKAITEYATSHAITDIVVGASTRNTFIRYIYVLIIFHGCTSLHHLDAYTENSINFMPCRRFRNPDVPTCLMKMAPDYCTIHVIHKGKAIQVKAAKVPAPFTTLPPKQHTQSNMNSDGSSR